MTPTTELRAAVFLRADGHCWLGDAGQLDHQFGRGAGRPAQSLENCWALHAECHNNKTNNRPSAAYWLERFVSHYWRRRYARERERAVVRLQFVRARGSA